MVITEDTTEAELAEALSHLVANARNAQDERIYDIWHRRINEHLDTWQTLSALNLFGPATP
jgi:hypothetical protein